MTTSPGNPLAKAIRGETGGSEAAAYARPLEAREQHAANGWPSSDLVEPSGSTSGSTPDDVAIARLRRASPGELWGRRPEQFIAWLRGDLELLSEAVGVVLQVDREAASPSADRALRLTDADRRSVVAIVDLNSTSDERLGVLVREVVAAGARVAIWITPDARPEHVAGLSWLNRSSDTHFHIIRLGAVQIGHSAAAPTFTQLLRPPRAGESDPSSAASVEGGRRFSDAPAPTALETAEPGEG